MHYVVKSDFADLQDNKRFYRAGSIYPREGFTVSEERLQELLGCSNLMGKPLIESVVDKDAAPNGEPEKLQDNAVVSDEISTVEKEPKRKTPRKRATEDAD